MDVFKFLLANGQESKTERFWVDADGVSWPIYRKKVAVAALANAGSVNVAHGVADIKLNAPFRPISLMITNAANSARVTSLSDIRLTSIVLTDATNIAITNTSDLTTYNTGGTLEFEYCKTSDNA
jgi:hypothetical protein